MRIPETLAPYGVALALVAGCTADHAEPPTPSPVEATVPAVHDEVQTSFENAKAFWLDQQLGGLAVTLVQPADGVSVTCGTETVSPLKAKEVIAAACFPNNKLFVWDKPLAEQAGVAVSKGAVLEDTVALVVSRQYASFVQRRLNVVGDQKTPAMKSAQIDCLAGASMRKSNPNALPSVKIFFDGVDEAIGRQDVKHGNAQQRLANFIMGFEPQPGGNCEKVLALATA